MSQFRGSSRRFVCRCALACASLLLSCSFASARVVKTRAGDDAGAGSNLSDAAPKWLVVRLRSFVPGASGRVVVEPTASGGRVRLTAARLPAPDSVAPTAHAYVVWATGGQVRRLGELRRDARGNAAFEFAHPGGFETYSVVVTAETDARAERPAGAPVFSTRAGEVSALYPTKSEPRAEESAGETVTRARTVTRAGAKENNASRAKSSAATTNTTTPNTTTPTPVSSTPAPRTTRSAPSVAPKITTTATPTRASSTPRASTSPRMPSTSRASSAPNAAEFYESIDAAVADAAGTRALTLAGEDGARAASGDAKVATRDGTAYVRVRFRRVPPPSRFGVRKYVMWAQPAADAPLFLRALPAHGLNRRDTYARRRNVNSDDFRLVVTAERSYPHPRPRGRQVLHTR
jgi:hypothetical protein